MKLPIFLFGAILTIFMNTSCQKSYTCNCTDGTPDNVVHSEEIEADSRDEAETECRSKGIECDID